MIDDATAMAAGGWTGAAPAQVVECAAIDAQELGGLVDGKKGRVVIVVVVVEHESGLRGFDVVNLCELEKLGE
jgi:predicted transcriptional regulator